MATVVQKYGGSSVADVAALGRVAAQIVARRRQGDRVVVVVSAMGKTTDELLRLAGEVASQPPRRELDMLVTAGERISMALLSMAIHSAGEAAISFTGSQSGIITEDSHGGARILEVRPYRITDELDAGRIVIVAGYQGVSTNREVTTLGRGGSDTTAVALAAALDAEACEIYSDVDGVYSADPRVCPQAKLIPELSYETMQTMAGAGAKVLNAQAVEFARRAGIVIEARKTGDGSGRRTRVSGAAGTGDGGDQNDDHRGVVAVVGASDVSLLFGPAEIPAAALAEVVELGGKPIATAVIQDDPAKGRPQLHTLIRHADVADPSAFNALASRLGLEVIDCAAVTLVGSGLASRPELLQHLRSAANGPIRCTIGDDVSISVTVARSRCDAVVRQLHGDLVA